jgi:hypothetical protein
LICQTTNFLGEKFPALEKKNSYDADSGGKKVLQQIRNLCQEDIDS